MRHSRLLRYGATTAVLVTVAYFFARGLADNWAAIRTIDFRFNVWSLLAILAFAFAVVVSGLVWGRMLSHLGQVPVRRSDAVRVQCASWLLKYVPGQVGSVVNKVVWGSSEGIAKTLVLLSAVYENVFLLLGSILPAVVILAFGHAFTGNTDAMREQLLLPLLAIIPLALVTNRAFFSRLVNILARRVLKQPVPAQYFLSSADAFRYQLAFLLPRIINGIGFALIVRSFLVVPGSAYLPLAAGYVLAGAIGIMAVFVPSGLGVRESVIVLLASRYMPVEQAIVLSLVARLYSTIGDGVIAVVYGLLKGHHLKEKRTS